MSVLAVGQEGDAGDFSVAGEGGDEHAQRFARVQARLLRWGWLAPEGQAMTERLARRDREADDRVICAGECAHYRPGRCGNHRRAGLNVAEVGRDFAGLLQRCPGFESEG